MIAVVDVDSTLGRFAPMLHAECCTVNPDCPPPSRWDEWEWWRPYMDQDTFYGCVNRVHENMGVMEPMPGAPELTCALHDRGIWVIIATHRRQEYRSLVEDWLWHNGIGFEAVHVSFDKSVLFREADIVVDDSPKTVRKAVAMGVSEVYCPAQPWNREVLDPVFRQSLPEIAMKIREG